MKASCSLLPSYLPLQHSFFSSLHSFSLSPALSLSCSLALGWFHQAVQQQSIALPPTQVQRSLSFIEKIEICIFKNLPATDTLVSPLSGLSYLSISVSHPLKLFLSGIDLLFLLRKEINTATVQTAVRLRFIKMLRNQ